jgi:hypothetical protein
VVHKALPSGRSFQKVVDLSLECSLARTTVFLHEVSCLPVSPLLQQGARIQTCGHHNRAPEQTASLQDCSFSASRKPTAYWTANGCTKQNDAWSHSASYIVALKVTLFCTILVYVSTVKFKTSDQTVRCTRRYKIQECQRTRKLQN